MVAGLFLHSFFYLFWLASIVSLIGKSSESCLIQKSYVTFQTLTPHMQSSAAKTLDKCVSSSSCKNNKKANNVDHEQANTALELWKKAFKDACERLCPVRAGGHECGCLPVLHRLVPICTLFFFLLLLLSLILSFILHERLF